MMTITRQQAGKLRNSDSISGIGKVVLSTPKRPDGLYAPLCRLLRGTGRSFCCTKTSETCRCLLLFSLRMNLVVPPTLRVLMLSKMHLYYKEARNSTYRLLLQGIGLIQVE